MTPKYITRGEVDDALRRWRELSERAAARIIGENVEELAVLARQGPAVVEARLDAMMRALVAEIDLAKPTFGLPS